MNGKVKDQGNTWYVFKPLAEPKQCNKWKGQRSRSYLICCSNLLQSPGKAMNGKVKDQGHI